MLLGLLFIRRNSFPSPFSLGSNNRFIAKNSFELLCGNLLLSMKKAIPIKLLCLGYKCRMVFHVPSFCALCDIRKQHGHSSKLKDFHLHCFSPKLRVLSFIEIDGEKMIKRHLKMLQSVLFFSFHLTPASLLFGSNYTS